MQDLTGKYFSSISSHKAFDIWTCRIMLAHLSNSGLAMSLAHRPPLSDGCGSPYFFKSAFDVEICSEPGAAQIRLVNA